MSDLSPAQMRQITAAVYAAAPSRADRGRVFAGLRKHFAVASYRDIPAEKLGDVLRVISAYKIAKDAPAPQPKPKRSRNPNQLRSRLSRPTRGSSGASASFSALLQLSISSTIV